MAVVGDEEPVALVARDVERHAHRFGRRRGLIEERRVREREARQIGDHRLEVQERLEPPLADLRLVGRVLRVPAGVLEDVALDHGRRDAVVVTEPDEAAERAVARSHAAQLLDQRELAVRLREVERAVHEDAVGDGVAHERLHLGVAEKGQHLANVVVARTDVAGREDVARSERFEGVSRQPSPSLSI